MIEVRNRRVWRQRLRAPAPRKPRPDDAASCRTSHTWNAWRT